MFLIYCMVKVIIKMLEYTETWFRRHLDLVRHLRVNKLVSLQKTFILLSVNIYRNLQVSNNNISGILFRYCMKNF